MNPQHIYPKTSDNWPTKVGFHQLDPIMLDWTLDWFLCDPTEPWCRAAEPRGPAGGLVWFFWFYPDQNPAPGLLPSGAGNHRLGHTVVAQ